MELGSHTLVVIGSEVGEVTSAGRASFSLLSWGGGSREIPGRGFPSTALGHRLWRTGPEGFARQLDCASGSYSCPTAGLDTHGHYRVDHPVVQMTAPQDMS